MTDPSHGQPSDGRSGRLAALWRLPGAVGVALAALSIPLIALAGPLGFFVLVVVLCLYPFLELPRTLARRSWWLAALGATLVFIVLLVALPAVADALHPIGEGAMLLMAPAMLYPLLLAITVAVKLEGRINGRPAATAPRRAVISLVVTTAVLVGVPTSVGLWQLVAEKVTGNSPANTIYSSDGKVVTAGDGAVRLQPAIGDGETYHYDTATRFIFMGPGSAIVQGTADASWLKPGQQIGVSYITRRGEAQARTISIWIDRKGCARDEQWQAALRAAGPATLAGTAWDATTTLRTESGQPDTVRFELLDGGRAAWERRFGGRETNAEWRQHGAAVLIELNDCYALYDGRIDGDTMSGRFSNEVGASAEWTARRVAAGAPPPK